MPIGDGYGQLIRPTGITPLTEGVVSHSNPLGPAIARLGQDLESRAKPILIDRATEAGALAGENAASDHTSYESKPPFTDMAAAYNQAARQAYIARNNVDRDTELEELAIAHQNDPQAFMAAAQEARLKAIQNASPEYAVQLEQGWDRKIGLRHNRILRTTEAANARAHADDIIAEETTLKDNLEAHARNGTLQSEDAQSTLTRWQEIQQVKTQNPLFRFSPVESQRAVTSMTRRLTGLTIGSEVTTAFDTEIAGGATVAEAQLVAKRLMNERFNNNPALEGMGEAEKRRILSDADNAFTIHTDIARTAETVRLNNEREAAREKRERYSNNFGTLLAGADSGTLSEPQINGALARDEITPQQADTLRGNTRAAASRARAEAARIQSDIRRNQAEARRAQNADRRDEQRFQRERGADAADELRELARTNPEQAEQLARQYRDSGVINRGQFNSIASGARSERDSDDRFRHDDFRRNMTRLHVRSEDVDALIGRYDRWVDANPSSTTQQREQWLNTASSGYVERARRAAAERRSAPTSRQSGGVLGSRTRVTSARDRAIETEARRQQAERKNKGN